MDPVLDLVPTISKGPLVVKLKTISALVSLLKVRLRMLDGASRKFWDQTFILMWRLPSSCTVLSILRYGAIVSAFKLSEILPRVPALGKSEISYALAISSAEQSGVASKIDWKLPIPWLGLKEILKVCSHLALIMTCLGVISKTEFFASSGSTAEKLNLKGCFFLSKLWFEPIEILKTFSFVLSRSFLSKIFQSI